MRPLWSGHGWQLDAIRWSYELLPESEKPQLARAIALIDAAIRGEKVEPMMLDGAVAQIAAVVARNRPSP